MFARCLAILDENSKQVGNHIRFLKDANPSSKDPLTLSGKINEICVTYFSKRKFFFPIKDGAAKTCGICWSSNGQKLAVASAERVVFLFDANGEKRDKFSTKPADSKVCLHPHI